MRRLTHSDPSARNDTETARPLPYANQFQLVIESLTPPTVIGRLPTGKMDIEVRIWYQGFTLSDLTSILSIPFSDDDHVAAIGYAVAVFAAQLMSASHCRVQWPAGAPEHEVVFAAKARGPGPVVRPSRDAR